MTEKGRSRGRRVHGTTTRGGKSKSPTNRRNADNSTIRWGNFDENVVSFPLYGQQNDPNTLFQTDSEAANFFSIIS